MAKWVISARQLHARRSRAPLPPRARPAQRRACRAGPCPVSSLTCTRPPPAAATACDVRARSRRRRRRRAASASRQLVGAERAHHEQRHVPEPGLAQLARLARAGDRQPARAAGERRTRALAPRRGRSRRPSPPRTARRPRPARSQPRAVALDRGEVDARTRAAHAHEPAARSPLPRRRRVPCSRCAARARTAGSASITSEAITPSAAAVPPRRPRGPPAACSQHARARPR